MAFCLVDKRVLANELKRGIVEVVFVDEENLARSVKCTLATSDMPKQSLEDIQLLDAELSSAGNVIPAWDVLSYRWGLIPLDKIISIQLV